MDAVSGVLETRANPLRVPLRSKGERMPQTLSYPPPIVPPSQPRHSSQNALLATMEGSALRALEPFFSTVSIPKGTVVHDVGEEIERVYFPISGIASLQHIPKTGRPVDTALVGREGALGIMAGIARYKAKDRSITRTALISITISGLDLRRFAYEHRGLKTMCINHMDRLLSQTQRNSARYALLSIDARLSDCLLEASDYLASDTVPFGHEAIAEMLAVRRTSVTAAASKLRATGIISYARGTIRILDRGCLLKLAQGRTK